MIVIAQIIIIASALALLFYGLSGRRSHFGRAWKKIGLLLLAIAMIIAVIFPNTTNRLAHLVGIGRGADLLLYMLTLAFITYVLNSYLQQQDAKDELCRLARRVALIDATDRYRLRRK